MEINSKMSPARYRDTTEISDEHIKNLDDLLPKMLLKYDIIVS
jgi:hypothetical protein